MYESDFDRVDQLTVEVWYLHMNSKRHGVGKLHGRIVCKETMCC